MTLPVLLIPLQLFPLWGKEREKKGGPDGGCNDPPNL
jgi:hypothetical protein